MTQSLQIELPKPGLHTLKEKPHFLQPAALAHALPTVMDDLYIPYKPDLPASPPHPCTQIVLFAVQEHLLIEKPGFGQGCLANDPTARVKDGHPARL